jgi:molybdenum cofactor cytidylyltransferase
MDSNFTTIILASGLSERMGEPKALLRWNNSTTFLEKIIFEYSKACCTRIICMINKETETFCQNLNRQPNIKFVINPYPEWGRFYAIKTAVKEVLDYNFCFIQNVDNPFVSIEIIDKLYAVRSFEAWCSPVYMGKGGHPVLLPQLIIKKIFETNNNYTTLLDILKPFPRIKVETDSDEILRNINTPVDYLKFFKRKS